MASKFGLCLHCYLADCDEKHPGCLLKEELTSANQRWYIKLKNDPVRYKEYLLKKQEQQKKWLQTPRGRTLWNAQIERYRKKHPETMKAAYKRYHEKNKEKRNAQVKEYRRKGRELRKEILIG